MMKIFLTVFLFIFLCGCSPEKTENVNTKTFYDLRGYFTSEAERLKAENIYVQKTVYKNGESEQKTISNLDWLKEFDLFISNDINKPAWIKSYREIKTDTLISYTPIDSNLTVKSLQIRQVNGVAHSIYLHRYSKNSLYTSNEKFYYFPDSLYRIERNQQVRWLGETIYKIEGKLLK